MQVKTVQIGVAAADNGKFAAGLPDLGPVDRFPYITAVPIGDIDAPPLGTLGKAAVMGQSVALETGQELTGGSDTDLTVPYHLLHFFRADAIIFRDPQDHRVIRIISGFLYNIRVLIRDRFPLRALCFFSLRIRPGIDLPLFFRNDLFPAVVRLFRVSFRGHDRECCHSHKQTP